MTRAKSAQSKDLQSHRNIAGLGPCTAMWPPENTDVTAFSFGDSVYVTVEHNRPVFVADAHLDQAKQSGFTVYGSSEPGHVFMVPPAGSFFRSFTSPATGRLYIGSNESNPTPREVSEFDVPYLQANGWKDSGPRSSPLSPTEPITRAEFEKRVRAAQEAADPHRPGLGRDEILVTGGTYRIK